jgi:hypothetical protein
MGIYLGQLPPAEVARFKAELAETLIANFCYPRFFDQRTQSLRMRPVDRAKRQEVWLYLSSVDFTQWGRVDLLSPDFQVQIERLFIQFVQRNRAFFGEQGRRRMSDIRMLIGSAAGGVVQGLRGHLTGQKGKHPFGSPRPVMSWSAMANGKTEMSWEQISASTIVLQQQLQDVRGEGRPTTPVAEPRPVATTTARRPVRSTGEANGGFEQSGTSTAPQAPTRPVAPVQGSRRMSAPLPTPVAPAASVATPRRPDVPMPPATQHEVPSSPSPARGAPADPRRSEPLERTSGPLERTSGPLEPLPSDRPSTGTPLESRKSGPLTTDRSITASRVAVAARMNGAGAQGATVIPTTGEGQAILGEDVAIFDQMRHQLLLWLRVEALTAGIEIGGQSPAQLLDALRQQGRQDETRLQVVSSLLNLANQVIKAGTVSLLDYKQALMLHLMHTRR